MSQIAFRERRKMRRRLKVGTSRWLVRSGGKTDMRAVCPYPLPRFLSRALGKSSVITGKSLVIVRESPGITEKSPVIAPNSLERLAA